MFDIPRGQQGGGGGDANFSPARAPPFTVGSPKNCTSSERRRSMLDDAVTPTTLHVVQDYRLLNFRGQQVQVHHPSTGRYLRMVEENTNIFT